MSMRVSDYPSEPDYTGVALVALVAAVWAVAMALAIERHGVTQAELRCELARQEQAAATWEIAQENARLREDLRNARMFRGMESTGLYPK